MMGMAIMAAGGMTVGVRVTSTLARRIAMRIGRAGPIAPHEIVAALADADETIPDDLAKMVRLATETGYEATLDVDARRLTFGPTRCGEPALAWPTWHAIATLRSIGLPIGLEPEEVPASRVASAAELGLTRIPAEAEGMRDLAGLARYALDTYGPSAMVAFR